MLFNRIDQADEITPGLGEVTDLVGQEAASLFKFSVFTCGKGIDGTKPIDLGLEIGQLAF